MHRDLDCNGRGDDHARVYQGALRLSNKQLCSSYTTFSAERRVDILIVLKEGGWTALSCIDLPPIIS